MLTKESKYRILENFYGLDYALFGKPVNEVKVCCPFFTEEYTSAKGALLSALIEIYEITKHSPKVINEQLSGEVLKKMAKRSAKIARENSEKLVTSKAGRNDIKKSLRESISHTKDKKVNIEKAVQEHIRRKAYSLAVDHLLLGRTINETKNFEVLDTWKGKVIGEAYKTLRDNLVEHAMTILENVTPK